MFDSADQFRYHTNMLDLVMENQVINNLMTPKELAADLGIGHKAVYYWHDRESGNRLNMEKLGGRWVIDSSDAISFLRSEIEELQLEIDRNKKAIEKIKNRSLGVKLT